MQNILAEKYNIEPDELEREIRTIALFLVDNYKKGSATGFAAMLDLLRNGDIPTEKPPKTAYRVGLVFNNGKTFMNSKYFSDKSDASKLKFASEKIVPEGVEVKVFEIDTTKSPTVPTKLK